MLAQWRKTAPWVLAAWSRRMKCLSAIREPSRRLSEAEAPLWMWVRMVPWAPRGWRRATILKRTSPRWCLGQSRTDGAKHISLEVYLGSGLLPPPLQCKKCFLLGHISDSPSSPARFDRSLFTIPPPLLTHQHQHFSPTLWDGDHSAPYVPPDHVLLLDKDHTPHMAVTLAPSLGPARGQSSSKQGWLH